MFAHRSQSGIAKGRENNAIDWRAPVSKVCVTAFSATSASSGVTINSGAPSAQIVVIDS
nr:hypothetical protein [Nitrincola nitratireducens]